MAAAKKGLGKGLGALLSSEGIPEDQKDSVVELKINDVSPNTDQPRKTFDEERLNELADSIKENGVIQPIIVQRKAKGYTIVAGERRWRAARLAGLKLIPAIVRDLTDKQVMEQALIENLQREDLNPLEEAEAMQSLIKTHHMTQDQLSKKLGKPRATIANALRLLNLDESLHEFLVRGDLSAGHAKAILSLKDREDQRKVADVIIERDMSVRQAEEYVRKYVDLQNNPKPAAKAVELDPQAKLSIKEVETKLKKSLGSRVKIKPSGDASGKGKIGRIRVRNGDMRVGIRQGKRRKNDGTARRIRRVERILRSWQSVRNALPPVGNCGQSHGGDRKPGAIKNGKVMPFRVILSEAKDLLRLLPHLAACRRANRITFPYWGRGTACGG